MTASERARPRTEPRERPESHPVAARLRANAHWLVPALLVLAAGVLLLRGLDTPPRIIFDETYYVEDARSFLVTGGVEDSFAVHPPVGKWLIASTIQLAGDGPVGWRLAGALAGTVMVLVTYLLGLRLLRRRWQAVTAALLLLADGLFLVQARTSMLDIFLALFVLVGTWLLVGDLQDLDERARSASALRGRSLRYRWLAGVAFGLAIATKWSGLLALGVAVILVLGFEVIAHRRVHGRGVGAGRALGVLVGPLLLLPAVTYLASYTPWLANYEHTTEGKDECPGAAEGLADCDVGVGGRLAGLAREHRDIYRFHRDLESTHSYRSEPWTWPVLGRPVAYYYETCREQPPPGEEPCEVPLGTAGEVLALGNPALWWGFLALAPLLLAGMGRRDPTAWILGGFYGGLYLPWLAVSRLAFLFYMVPAIAFMALAVAWALGRLRTAPTDGIPWAAGAGVGLLGAVTARIAGAGTTPSAMAFAVGWIFAPLVATATIDWWQRRRAGAPEQAGATAASEPSEPSEPSLPTSRVAPTPPAPPRWWPRVGTPAASPLPAIAVTTVLLVASFWLLLYFLPAWTGVPIDPEALRSRWWFSTWI